MLPSAARFTAELSVGPILMQDCAAVAIDHGLPGGLPRGKDVMGVLVGVQDRHMLLRQPAAHTAFAGGDSTGQADAALARHDAAAG